MPKIAIISIDPRDRGGVRTMVEEAWLFAQTLGRPHLFFLNFDPRVSARLRPFSYQSSTIHGIWEGKSFTAIGARWAFWEPGHYYFTRKSWQDELQGYDYFFVVSGTPIAGHILTLLKKKFILWVASNYDEDRRVRRAQFGILRTCIDRLARPMMHHIESRAIKQAHAVCSISSYTNALWDSWDHQKYSIVGVPLSKQTVHAVQAIQQAPTNSKAGGSIIAVGRFTDPRKNLLMLLRVFACIRSTISHATLTIIGSVPTHVTSDMPGVTMYSQRLRQEQLYEHVAQAQLMLISSYQEGLSIVGIEALAHGVPVVSTRCGGVEDYVIEGKTGYLVEVNDDRAMADRAVDLLQNPMLCHSMGNAGQALVKKKYTGDIIHQKLRAVFTQVYGLHKSEPI